MNKNLVILDVVRSDISQIDKKILKNSDILSLTPLSHYYLENRNINFYIFHDLINQKDFKKLILKFYEKLFLEQNYRGIFREIAQYINYFTYIDIILKFIENKKYKNIIYISDKMIKFDNELSNNTSLLLNNISFNKVIKLDRFNINIKSKKYKNIKLIKIKNKLLKHNLKYDWLYVIDKFFIKKEQITLEQTKLTYQFNNYIINIILKQTNIVSEYNTYLTKDNYFHLLKFKINNKVYFFQHGAYLYKNLFLKFAEIEPANINFVFNDYTKNLFENLGAKKVYSIGSILFNKKIKERKKEYDFLYIIQAHDYLGNLQYVDFENSLHSFDGYELYQRHKHIIKLFGEKFKDKKIVIRVYPLILTSGVYVPFWELAKGYSNITIDSSIPIHTLIEKSKYIISDYFTSEFINREIHYKRDIILFQGAPTPLPKDTIDDMKKMFILVETINDLESKIENITEITKNRKRYDDIIEYYSSKKCDTKKLVNEILKKELK